MDRDDSLTAHLIEPTRELPVPWKACVDGIAIINLITSESRLAHVRRQFSNFQGLSPEHLTIFRRVRDPSSFVRGCADSHRAVCLYALKRGWRRVWICEDDLRLPEPGTKAFDRMRSTSLAQRMDGLPGDWMRLMLGYVPVLVSPGRRGLTLCTTSYIASVHYMRLMAVMPYDVLEVRLESVRRLRQNVFGAGIDHSLSWTTAFKTHVVWPAPVLVDVKEGSSGTHGTFWSNEVSIPRQHAIQQAFWLVPLGAIIVLPLLFLLTITLPLYLKVSQDAAVISAAVIAGTCLLALALGFWLVLSGATGPRQLQAPSHAPRRLDLFIDCAEGDDSASGMVEYAPLRTLERAREVARRAWLDPHGAVVTMQVRGEHSAKHAKGTADDPETWIRHWMVV